MKKKDYYITHSVQYYETDQMKVVHHANYVKWMEEARGFLFKSIGIDISKIEERRIYLAVLSQNVNYIKSAKYGDQVKIVCRCTKLTSAKIEFCYEFYIIDGSTLCAVGQTIHCFVNDKLEPIIFKKILPQEYSYMSDLLC